MFNPPQVSVKIKPRHPVNNSCCLQRIFCKVCEAIPLRLFCNATLLRLDGVCCIYGML